MNTLARARAAELTTEGIATLKAGNRPGAQALLQRAVMVDPSYAQAWLWLSELAPTLKERRYCLARVLELEPNNEAAARGLANLDSMPDPSAQPGPPKPGDPETERAMLASLRQQIRTDPLTAPALPPSPLGLVLQTLQPQSAATPASPEELVKRAQQEHDAQLAAQQRQAQPVVTGPSIAQPPLPPYVQASAISPYPAPEGSSVAKPGAPEAGASSPLYSGATPAGYPQVAPRRKRSALAQALIVLVSIVAGIGGFIVGAGAIRSLSGGSSTPAPPTVTPIPGWHKLSNADEGVELWLPVKYEQITPSEEQVDSFIDASGKLLPEYAEAMEQLKGSDEIKLWTFDVGTLGSGFATNVIVMQQSVRSSVEVPEFISTSLKELDSSGMSIKVVEKKDNLTINGYKAGRIVLQQLVMNMSVMQVMYILKDGGSMWMMTCTTRASEYQQRMPTFEKSVQSLRFNLD